MSVRPLLVLLAGPTATGKTARALALAETLGAEIVNADSMQVYRRMDIGTAKPDPGERARVPHHLLDVADPDEHFDAARYAALAREAVSGIHRRGRLPLVVGGTGLYMRALTRGLCESPAIPPEVRAALREECEARGAAALHGELSRVDPETAARLHPNDRQRVLRAIEVFRASGTPLSHLQAAHRFLHSPYRAVKIALERPREELHARIGARVSAMLAAGFREEVLGLIEAGYGCDLRPMQSLGYKEMCAHLAGALPLAEAAALIARETRRYARRQLTWFRGDPEFTWFHADDHAGILSHLRKHLPP